MEKEIVNQVQESQSPIEDKSKEKHAKTHTNQRLDTKKECQKQQGRSNN